MHLEMSKKKQHIHNSSYANSQVLYQKPYEVGIVFAILYKHMKYSDSVYDNSINILKQGVAEYEQFFTRISSGNTIFNICIYTNEKRNGL